MVLEHRRGYPAGTGRDSTAGAAWCRRQRACQGVWVRGAQGRPGRERWCGWGLASVRGTVLEALDGEGLQRSMWEGEAWGLGSLREKPPGPSAHLALGRALPSLLAPFTVGLRAPTGQPMCLGPFPARAWYRGTMGSAGSGQDHRLGGHTCRPRVPGAGCGCHYRGAGRTHRHCQTHERSARWAPRPPGVSDGETHTHRLALPTRKLSELRFQVATEPVNMGKPPGKGICGPSAGFRPSGGGT